MILLFGIAVDVPPKHGMNLKFSAPGPVPGVTVVGYEVYRDGAKIAKITKTSYFDQAPKGKHTWFVTALGNNGTESPASNSFTSMVP